MKVFILFFLILGKLEIVPFIQSLARDGFGFSQSLGATQETRGLC